MDFLPFSTFLFSYIDSAPTGINSGKPERLFYIKYEITGGKI